MTTDPGRKRRTFIRSYRDLAVWQMGMDLVVASYRLTKRLPAIEKYELAGQIRRASVSVPTNIAEGYGRRHLGDYVRHLYIANGSLKELETEILLTERLEYLVAEATREALGLADRVGRMLASLTRNLKESSIRVHA
jgi:four helix bundle protein